MVAPLALAVLLCAGVWTVSAQEHAPEAEAHGEAHGEDLTLWKWANFAILVAGLGYLISKKGGPFFDGRTREIRKGIAEATRLREDAEARAADIERRVSGLAADIEALRRSSREEMAAEGERIKSETEQMLAKVRLHTEQEIQSASKLARQELKAYSVQLAMELAEQRVRSQVTPQDQANLVNAFVRDLGNGQVQGEAQ